MLVGKKSLLVGQGRCHFWQERALLVFGWFELGLLGAWMSLPEEVEVVPLAVQYDW